VRSKSQKDAYYYELINLKRDEIVDVPQAEIVRALQMSGLSDLEKAIEKQDKQRAEQQQKVDEQEQLALKLGNSQVISNLSLAKEREARVIADIGLAEERHSEAASNQADAVLARAKAMVELSQMNEDRMIKVYTLLSQMQDEEAEAQDAVSDKSRELAAAIDQSVDAKEQQSL